MNLKELFELQGQLNVKVGFDHEKFANVFTRSCTREDVLIEAGQWIDDFLKAMSSEIEELRRHTYWKHWCSEAQSGKRYMVKDVDAARGEVIDMLHFWVSLAQALGMTPKMVEKRYREKLAINITRQVDGYSIEQKDLAWKLFKKYPYDNPMSFGWPDAESLEDLPRDIQVYYLEWARVEIAEDVYCDCISMDYYLYPDDPSLEVNPQPQPNPNCKKCGGSGYKSKKDVGYSIIKKDEVGEIPNCCQCGKKCKAGYVMTGEGPICGSCI